MLLQSNSLLLPLASWWIILSVMLLNSKRRDLLVYSNNKTLIDNNYKPPRTNLPTTESLSRHLPPSHNLSTKLEEPTETLTTSHSTSWGRELDRRMAWLSWLRSSFICWKKHQINVWTSMMQWSSCRCRKDVSMTSPMSWRGLDSLSNTGRTKSSGMELMLRPGLRRGEEDSTGTKIVWENKKLKKSFSCLNRKSMSWGRMRVY